EHRVQDCEDEGRMRPESPVRLRQVVECHHLENEWHGDAEGCAIDEDLGHRELKYPDKLQRLHDAKRDGSHEGRDSEREPEVADSHWRAPLAPSRSSRSVPDRTTYDDRHRNRRTWNRQL